MINRPFSPTIVDNGADLAIAAKRIIWGKLINAGQICVAPDYVLYVGTQRDKLIEHMIEAIKELYGEDQVYPLF